MKYCLFFLLNDSYVELEGVEPSSKQGNHMLSTCLSLLKFSCCSKTKATNCCLILCFFATRTRLRATIPDLSAPLYQIASGRGHLRDVSSWHLVSGWSLIYSIRLSSKSVIIFASYCFGNPGFTSRHSDARHAYIPFLLAVKTKQPQWSVYSLQYIVF